MVSAYNILGGEGVRPRAANDVARLGADRELVSIQLLRRLHDADDRLPDGTLRSLPSIVQGGVDKVDSAAERRNDGFGVVLIGFLRSLTEVSTYAQRGNRPPLCFAKERCLL